MDTAKDRLLQYLKHLKVGQNKFEKMCGISNGYINNLKASPSSKTIQKITAAFPELNISWLLTGEGQMLSAKEFEKAEAPALVPLYSLAAVAGLPNAGEQEEYVVENIAWHGARPGDFAITVCGSSMQPRIPSGALLLLRPYAFTDWRALEFGRVHAIVATDGRAFVKTLRADGDALLLHSENPDYPDVRLLPSEVRHLYIAVAVQHPL